jgi:hypothetical protein
MNLEELFAYLAEAAVAHQFDRFVQSPLINGRFPDAEAQTITGLMGGLIEQLNQETSGIAEQIGEFRLIKVDELDNSAIIEVAPKEPRSKRITPANTDAFARPKAAVRNTPRLIKGSNIVRLERSRVE